MSKQYQKQKARWIKEGEKQALNTFLLWLDFLKESPKETWEEQIKLKAQQIFMEINK